VDAPGPAGDDWRVARVSAGLVGVELLSHDRDLFLRCLRLVFRVLGLQHREQRACGGDGCGNYRHDRGPIHVDLVSPGLIG
jgi:hypothetical protein